MIIETGRVKEIIKNNDIKLIDLVVILDNKCNAKCKICVAKQVIRHADCKGNCYGYKTTCVRCCDRSSTDEEFLSRLDDIFSNIHGKNVRVILTGGEPTLSNRLISAMPLIKKYEFLTVAIETNGAVLLEKEIVNALLSNDVTILLSRYGVAEDENSNEFVFSTKPVTNENIKEILKTYGDRVVLNCVLTKKNIENGQTLLDYYDYYEKLGAKHFNFTEIMFDTTLSAQNKTLSEFYQENRVVIEEISKDLELLGYKKIEENGDKYKTIEHSYKDKTIVLSRAEMSKIAYKQQNNNTYSKFLIYPSGEIGVHSIENR